VLSGTTLEVAAVSMLTLAFFGGFLMLLVLTFPAGESLRALVLDGRRAVPAASESGPEGVPARADADAAIASLDVLRPDVRRRSPETIAWDRARSGQPLHDRDAVQTGTDGRALVRFERGNDLQLERNSLIVVTRPVPTTDAPGPGGEGPAAGEATDGSRRRGLVLVEGEMLARLQAPDRTRLELALPDVVARLADTTSSAPARFRVTVRKDRSTTVAVLEGRVDLESRAGVVSVGPRQFSRVSARGEVSPPRALPGAPAGCEPASGTAYAHLDLPPRIRFAWAPVAGATHHHLRAARDAEFREVVLDETVAGDSLVWGRAAPGTYWWQVAGVVDGIEGMPTRTRTLVVQREALPPRLEVVAPPRVVHEPRLALRGTTDPRARLFVMGRPVTFDRDGAFLVDLELRAGANVVVVEAVDAAGHTAYWSQIVHVKP
jgi:hypothetical protein